MPRLALVRGFLALLAGEESHGSTRNMNQPSSDKNTPRPIAVHIPAHAGAEALRHCCSSRESRRSNKAQKKSVAQAICSIARSMYCRPVFRCYNSSALFFSYTKTLNTCGTASSLPKLAQAASCKQDETVDLRPVNELCRAVTTAVAHEIYTKLTATRSTKGKKTPPSAAVLFHNINIGCIKHTHARTNSAENGSRTVFLPQPALPVSLSFFSYTPNLTLPTPTPGATKTWRRLCTTGSRRTNKNKRLKTSWQPQKPSPSSGTLTACISTYSD